MLEEVRITGLGVIDDAVLELSAGFTALTGETGAGKTMVVTALGLLFGGRADPARVRPGAARAAVEGRLLVSPQVAREVEEAGGDLDDNGSTLVLSRSVSAEGARFISDVHARHGVALHCGVIVKALEREADRSERVVYGEGESVSADVVVAGVGMERHLALAEQAGLEIDGGIVVDEFGQTSAPGVYAAGDVAAFPHPLYGRRLRLESWRHAQNHGVAVGRAMAGAPVAYDDVPWFWTDQHGVNLQVAGLATEAARTVLRGPGKFTAIHLAEDGRVVGVTAADNPREIRAGTALIKARARPDPARLQDASVPLQSLIPR